jgi:nitrate reductase beta subunit
MPLTRTVRVPSMVWYVPPLGFRIVTICELEDGSCEVTLEPVALPSQILRMGAV